LLHRMSRIFEGTGLSTGGQDCHSGESGAHTGDISAAMLLDAGASFAIVGHSERRSDHGETSANVQSKAQAACKAGLAAIVCVGETEEERDRNIELEVVGRQLLESVPENANGDNLAVAYEPVWAIGTGRTPSIDDIEAVHEFARKQLVERFGASVGNSIRLLYGGSVKPNNAEAISNSRDVDGCLVGGASLNATSFAAIAKAFG
ncbi:MAG: triose-phosphate isomerase, partial [Albidovulum sp.]|nr:triose-phosphate isomerase [Albidovulum sp.]